MYDDIVTTRPQAPEKATLVVDVTPLLPGGGNGGAKWFVLALLAEMARQRPRWRWLLLTTAANDGLLGELLPWMERLRTIDGDGRPRIRPDPSSLPDGSRAHLLYCPFTAPFYACPAVPTVATVYDLQFAEYPQFFSRAEAEERARHFYQAATVCDILVCISDYVRNHAQRISGLDGERVRRIHISLPDRLPAPDPTAIPALLGRYGLVPRRYLIYPANTWPHKNHEMLLTAAGIYFARHPESDLKIICSGVSDDSRGQALKRAAQRMGLGGRAIFSGFLSERELSGLMRSARALIFPSLFEGFGMPVLEAMSLGVPVLSAKITSLPEITGDAALLFDPRRPLDIVRAIEAIEGDSALAGRLAAAGRRRARTLGQATTMAEGYLDLFAEVLADARRLRSRLRRRLFWLRWDLRWLYRRLQRARAFLGERLPWLRVAVRRIRRATGGARP